MSLTLLDTVRAVCRRLTLPVPNGVVGSLDVGVLQLLELLNEECRELADRSPWEQLITEITFTTLATESQGQIETIIGNIVWFNYIVNDTIYNRTTRLPIFGPLAPRDWQQRLASSVTGPYSQYRIRNGTLRFNPAPTAGQTCAFEYVNTLWCIPVGDVGGVGGGGLEVFNSDFDTTIFPDQLIRAGLIWRWKQAKGQDYAEDFARYERLVANAIGRNATKPRIDMGGDPRPRVGGVLIPEGSWSL